MKVTVTYFKPSGKYYAEEEVDLPDDCTPWAPEVKTALSLRHMHAVYMLGTPWGFPLMVPAEGTS